MSSKVEKIRPKPTFEPYALNPLISPVSNPEWTAHNVSCVLQYLNSLNHDIHACQPSDDNWQYGRHLINDVLINALRYVAGTLHPPETDDD